MCGFLSVDVVFSGEVPAETVAQGPNMVIQELSKSFGSPMLDAVLNKSPLDREMVHWLKHRPTVYQAMWDR